MIQFVGRTAFIPTADDLSELPDGSLISWLRIVGDETSRAVAFVHIEKRGTDEEIVWISPGGWSPMSPDEAGILYPAQVVIWGDLDVWLDGGEQGMAVDQEAALKTLETQVLATGGTWPREKALEAASRVYQGVHGPGWTADELADKTLDIAARFAEWLEGTIPTPQPPVTPENDTSPGAAARRFVAQRDAEAQRDLNTAEELRRVRTVLGSHRDELRPSATLMRRIGELAHTYQVRGSGGS